MFEQYEEDVIIMNEYSDTSQEATLLQGHERFDQIFNAVRCHIYTVYISDGQAVKTVRYGGCSSVSGYTSEDFETDADGQLVAVTLPWLVAKDEDQVMGMDNIIFANLKIDGKKFTVEVNSSVRAEKARRTFGFAAAVDQVAAATGDNTPNACLCVLPASDAKAPRGGSWGFRQRKSVAAGPGTSRACSGSAILNTGHWSSVRER